MKYFRKYSSVSQINELKYLLILLNIDSTLCI